MIHAVRMLPSPICLVIFLLTTVTYSVEALCNDSRQQYPRLFDTENYFECPQTSSWCDVTLKLIPQDNNSECWKFLQKLSIHRTQYNKTMVYRSLCIPRSNNTNLENFVVKKLNQELNHFNVTTKLMDIRCMKTSWRNGSDTPSYIFTVGTLYLLLLAVATCYENVVGRSDSDSPVKRILCCFSLFYLKKKPQAKTVTLKCMQGIRTMQSSVVIFGHIGMFLTQRNIENTDYIEFVFTGMQYVVSAGLGVLQTFFMISTWLLTKQILEIYDQSGKFSALQAVVKIVNRYLRVWPAVIFSIFFAQPFLYTYFTGPTTFALGSLTEQACSKYWWVTLLMATNWLKTDEMCHLGMWSLSIDLQLQLVAIVFFFVVLNSKKLDVLKSIYVMFIVVYAINVVYTYQYDVSVNAYIGLKQLAKLTYFLTDGLLNSYLSFWPNVGSGIVGMLFGYFYYLSKDKDGPEPYEKYYMFISVVFPIVGVVGPFMVIENKLVTALVFPIFRPLFSFGVATCIYGMAKNVIQGRIKSLCENKYLTKLGSYSYGVYIMHFLFIFSKDGNLTSTYEIEIITIIMETFKESVKSYLAGIVLTYMIITPFANLQKIIVPTIKEPQKKTEDQDVNKIKVQ